MNKIKPTSKADIDKKVKELNEVTNLLSDLITTHNIIRGKINLIFSESFEECYKQSGYMKSVTDQFNEGLYDVMKIHNNVILLAEAIVPAIDNSHWEDLEDPNYVRDIFKQ